MKQFSNQLMKVLPSLLILVLCTLPAFLISDEAPDYYFILSEKIKANASSVLIEPGKSKTKYSAEKAMDGKTDTFWCEGKEDDGVGETLSLNWKPTLIEGLQIGHGVLLNRNFYQLNNRIKEYELTVKYSTGRSKVVEGKFSDHSCQNKCEDLRRDENEYKDCLKERKNECIFETVGEGYLVGGERINDIYGCVTGIELKILSVYPGKKFKDTCISEIKLRVPEPRNDKTSQQRVQKEKDACK